MGYELKSYENCEMQMRQKGKASDWQTAIKTGIHAAQLHC